MQCTILVRGERFRHIVGTRLEHQFIRHCRGRLSGPEPASQPEPLRPDHIFFRPRVSFRGAPFPHTKKTFKCVQKPSTPFSIPLNTHLQTPSEPSLSEPPPQNHPLGTTSRNPPLRTTSSFPPPLNPYLRTTSRKPSYELSDGRTVGQTLSGGRTDGRMEGRSGCEADGRWNIRTCERRSVGRSSQLLGRWDGRTDGRTAERTDGRTDNRHA